MQERTLKMKKQFRQGDVFLQPIAKLPAGLTPRGNHVLAYGEVTGHSHQVADIAAADVLVGPNGELYLSVKDERGAVIAHEEHGPITVPKGDYEVRIQREYQPDSIRSVID